MSERNDNEGFCNARNKCKPCLNIDDIQQNLKEKPIDKDEILSGNKVCGNCKCKGNKNKQ